MKIKEKILELAQKEKVLKTRQMAAKFGVSRQLVSRALSEMVAERKIIKIGSTKSAFYTLPENQLLVGEGFHLSVKNEGLAEHEILERVMDSMPLLRVGKENLLSIFRYAFSEMLNNAIDHSKSKSIDLRVTKTGTDIVFVIEDNGVGVFRDIMNGLRLKNEQEAIGELMKGKTTTKPRAHSGEGIFFTSKIADMFMLESYGWKLTVDNEIPDTFVEEVRPPKKGTRVTFVIAQNTPKHLGKLFEKYQSDEEFAFDRTDILVKLFALGTIYVSRSQAKRLLARLDKFKKITLDYDGVPAIGQAFADEIYRVFANEHPDIKIETVNANDAVRFMIGRVGK